MKPKDLGYGPLALGFALIFYSLYQQGFGNGWATFTYLLFDLGVVSTIIGAAIRLDGIQKTRNLLDLWLLKRSAVRSAEMLKAMIIDPLDHLERRATLRMRQRGQTLSCGMEGRPVWTRIDGKWVVAEGIVAFFDFRIRNPHADKYDHVARIPFLHIRVTPTSFGSRMQIWNGDTWTSHEWAEGVAEAIRSIDCLYAKIEEVTSIGPRSSVRTAEF